MAKKILQIINNHFELAKDNIIYISGDYTKFHMVKMFGSALSIYDDTATLREDWNYYNAIHGADFIRLLDGFMKEYNPIENYDRYEDTTVDFTKGTQVDDFQSAEKNGSIENKVSAFDADGYSNSNKSDTHSAGYTDISTSGSREDSTDTTSHIHGNIGVTTNAQMLQGEALIRYNDLVNKYIERWARGVLVGYDDYTGSDAGAPVEDYATKAELNAVKGDVNALDTRVDTAENNINRIDTSVNGALEYITELYSQVDEVANNVSGLTNIVDNNTDDIANLNTEAENLDTRVTALENTPSPSSEVIYSTEERVIGKWIDGKPLYRKCITLSSDISNIPYNTYTAISEIVIPGIKTLINVNALNLNNTRYIVQNGLFRYAPTDSCLYYFNLRNATVGFSSGSIFIVEYTKVSD